MNITDQIQKKNSFNDQYNLKLTNFVKSKLLNFLSIKPRTESEIRNKIKSTISHLQDIELDNQIKIEIENSIVEKFKELNLINDFLYAKEFIKEKINSKNPQNKIKIKKFLYQKKVPPAIIDKALENYTSDDEVLIIQKEISKKIKTIKETRSHLIKTKLIRYLLNKGYNYENVRTVVDRYLDVK